MDLVEHNLDDEFDLDGVDVDVFIAQELQRRNVSLPAAPATIQQPLVSSMIEELKDGRGIYINTKKGELYEGEWRDDKKNGRGRLLTRHGLQYFGEFQNDHKHGHGK